MMLFPAPAALNAQPIPTVGIEGRMEALLPVKGLRAKPVEKHSALTVRIAAEQPHGTLARYDLRYVGAVPGRYDLREFLTLENGAPAPELPPLPVEIAGVLPAQHDGSLAAAPPGRIGAFGSYKTLIIAAGVLWAICAIPLFLLGRRSKQVETTEDARPPSLADRLRPLVESAARGDLDAHEKARLERLLLGHWREQLGLEGLDAHEAVARMRTHHQAGALLRALEDWLHRPPGAAEVDVEAALAPYRDLSPSEPAAQKTAAAPAS